MHYIAIVQARMGSRRLPGKAMMPLAGRPLLDHVLERAEQIQGLSGLVFATSCAERDEALADLAGARGWKVMRGSEHDVLGRFCAAVRMFDEIEAVMRITGDCPLLCPLTCQAVLVAYVQGSHSYVTNDTRVSGYPDGTDCEVMTVDALRQADRCALGAHDREHVTPWIARELPARIINCPVDWSRYKLSVDMPEDLEYVRQIYGHLPQTREQFWLSTTMEAVMAIEAAEML